MEKPFYISQLPEKTQAWIKEKTKENFLKDGMSEEEAEQKATDFLDEKVNVAEDFFGKDFYKSVDAIKDNFTPPGAKDEEEKAKDDDDLEVENLKEKYVNSKPAREENVPGENYKRYPSFMKKKADDELDEYLKDLDKYLSKNPKGRDDIPVTTRR